MKILLAAAALVIAGAATVQAAVMPKYECQAITVAQAGHIC